MPLVLPRTCRHVEDASKFLNEQQFKKTRLDKHRPPMIAPPQVHVLCNAHCVVQPAGQSWRPMIGATEGASAAQCLRRMSGRN